MMAENGFVLRFSLDVMTPQGSGIFHTSSMRITYFANISKTCVSGFDMVRCLDMNQSRESECHRNL